MRQHLLLQVLLWPQNHRSLTAADDVEPGTQQCVNRCGAHIPGILWICNLCQSHIYESQGMKDIIGGNETQQAKSCRHPSRDRLRLFSTAAQMTPLPHGNSPARRLLPERITPHVFTAVSSQCFGVISRRGSHLQGIPQIGIGPFDE